MAQILLASGSNARGQLAIGHTEDAHTFERCVFTPSLASGSSIIGLSCGANHTLAIISQPSVGPSLWRAGTSSNGQCGSVGTDTPVFVPVDLPQQYQHLRVQFVACLWESSIVVLSGPEEDVMLSFGTNDFGDLGRGDNAQPDPQPVDLARPTEGRTPVIIEIAAGLHHVVVLLDCLTENGMRRCAVGWGASRHGQLGPGAVDKLTLEPVLISSNWTGDRNRVDHVACGNQHTVLLRGDGSLETFGSNRRGQTERTTGSRMDIFKIACCWSTTLALDEHKVVHAFGNGAHGQLGLDVSSEPTIQANEFKLAGSIDRLVAGSEHVLALVEDDGQRIVMGWGWNEHGNLALGHTNDVLVPTQIWPSSSDSSLVLRGYVRNVWAGCGTTWIAVTEEQLDCFICK